MPFRGRNIEKGELFILHGIISYIDDVGVEYISNGEKNSRMRVIFQNETEARLLKRSFVRQLYKDPNSRKIISSGLKNKFSRSV